MVRKALDVKTKSVRNVNRQTRGSIGRLTLDEALLALLIGAMDASGHISPEEAERAHNIIWSMRRFRRKSGEAVGRRIERMRTLVGQHGASAAIDAAARVIPARLRPTAFAVAADLILADGRIERSERRFLDRLGTDLRLARATTRTILDVMLVKNSA
jgi:tellurite resistance protein